MGRFKATYILVLKSGSVEQNVDMKHTELKAKYFYLSY